MERANLAELHFITSIGNLASILKVGIVCNRRSKSLGAVSIALEEVQAKRAMKHVPGGLMLHEYANLYINARNPMLYKRLNLQNAICVLSVDHAVLDLPDVVITDQNAASKWARFAAAPGGIEIVDGEMTFAEQWKHPDDQILEWRHKSAMCAEVLVPECVLPKYIKCAYVANDVAASNIRSLGLNIRTVIHHRLFFR